MSADCEDVGPLNAACNLSKSPVQQLCDEHAMAMHALALAMKAARCWADVVDIAEAMCDVEYRQFRPRFKEAAYLAQEMPGAAAFPTSMVDATELLQRAGEYRDKLEADARARYGAGRAAGRREG